MIQLVKKLPDHVRLSQYLRKKARGFFQFQLRGFTYYIPATKEIRQLMKVKRWKVEMDNERAMMDIANALQLQVRDQHLAGVADDVKDELFSRLDRLIDQPIRRRIEQLATQTEQEQLTKGSSDGRTSSRS